MKAEVILTDDDGAVYRHVAEMPTPTAARQWEAWVNAACSVTGSAMAALHEATGIARYVRKLRRRERERTDRLAQLFDQPPAAPSEDAAPQEPEVPSRNAPLADAEIAALRTVVPDLTRRLTPCAWHTCGLRFYAHTVDCPGGVAQPDPGEER